LTPETPALWRYIPAHDYSPPAEPAGETVRSGLRDLWRSLRRVEAPRETAEARKDLRSVPQGLLDVAAPAPTWDEAVNGLDHALRSWLEADDPEPTVRVFAGPPGSGTAQVVTRWAKEQDWRIIEAPSPSNILEGGENWLAHVKERPEAPLAIPRLERCYLRHHDGIDPIRRLLGWLSTAKRRCLIGCDSWGMGYLSKAAEIDSIFSACVALEPFDGLRFQRWFGLLCASCKRGPFRCHQADTGESLLPIADGATDVPDTGGTKAPGNEIHPGVPDFIQYLAGRSRGIPGVGWAIWRHSLKIVPDDERAWDVEDPPTRQAGRTLWVRPWSQLNLPSLPPGAGIAEAFVLHTLLLHGGLPGELLPQLLPLHATQILKSVHGLRAASLLQEEAGAWYVTALGYPAVRQFLRNEGYLVNAF